MRRLRNLALFGIATVVVLVGLVWIFRAQLAPFLSVNVDSGAGGRAELVVPGGFVASVFAEGLSDPRFMDVSAEGVLFVAERGADRIVALPDGNEDGVADEIAEVGSGYGRAHDIEFTDDGALLVAGEAALYRVTLDGLADVDRQALQALPSGGRHNTKTVETLYEIVDGADAGWPRCHAGTIADPEFGTGAAACAGVAQPAATFPAHTAPLALLAWEDHVVIAFHGSWNSSVKVGYALWWLPWDGEPAGQAEPFVTGFLPDGATDALGRPAGLAIGGDGALYVSDDKAGIVYRIARSEPAPAGNASALP
jgi:glucose/arabinose dehydrogenase